MPLRKLIDNSSFAPEALAIIYEAFDLAWADIAPNYGEDVARIAFVRDTLARAVLAAAEREAKDATALKAAALETFARMKRSEG
jgi:hypothetical protein